MEGNMFCYQCQEAAKGTGCVLRGVCGKKDTTARYMDLLLFVVRGVSVAADTLRTKGYEVEAGTNEFVTDALSYTKLLQKREMRKDIVIELSYKGFSRASDYS